MNKNYRIIIIGLHSLKNGLTIDTYSYPTVSLPRAAVAPGANGENWALMTSLSNLKAIATTMESFTNCWSPAQVRGLRKSAPLLPLITPARNHSLHCHVSYITSCDSPLKYYFCCLGALFSNASISIQNTCFFSRKWSIIQQHSAAQKVKKVQYWIFEIQPSLKLTYIKIPIFTQPNVSS